MIAGVVKVAHFPASLGRHGPLFGGFAQLRRNGGQRGATGGRGELEKRYLGAYPPEAPDQHPTRKLKFDEKMDFGSKKSPKNLGQKKRHPITGVVKVEC